MVAQVGPTTTVKWNSGAKTLASYQELLLKYIRLLIRDSKISVYMHSEVSDFCPGAQG